MSLQRIIFASVALTMLCVRSSHAQFAYPGAFPSMYQPSPRMPWAPLPYGRSPFIPPMSFGASPAASSLMPSSLYAPSVAAAASAAGLRRPHPMSPFASPYAPASPSAGPGLAFGSSFAASYPVSAFAPAPMSPISPIAPSPFPMPSASSFSGVRFGSSSRPLQVTKLDDFEAGLPSNADGMSDSDLVAEATGRKKYIYGIRGNKYSIGKPWEAFFRR